MSTQLEVRTLGKSRIPVTSVGLGLWAVGGGWGEPRDDDSLHAIEAALDEGITFYDTADVYGMGHSEEILGKAMKGRRDRFVVATKIGWIGYDGERNCSAYDTVEKLIAGVEDSLRRLQIDSIDIIQSHIHYREPNFEVFLEGFQKLQEQGKVRAYGVSTSDFEYLKQFNADGGCATLQIDYSLLNRTAEKEILPYCQENGIGVIVRGALAMGRLTGKFTGKEQFEEGDFRRSWVENEDEHRIFMEDLAIVEKLKELGQDGRTPAQIALQFVRSNPAVTTVIPGGRSPRQVRENVIAGRLPLLSNEDRRFIDGLVPPGGGRKIWPA
ncbi:aldo/keto reductase [bacterium]|nr:aldo/keto reductase [bacterium]